MQTYAHSRVHKVHFRQDGEECFAPWLESDRHKRGIKRMNKRPTLQELHRFIFQALDTKTGLTIFKPYIVTESHGSSFKKYSFCGVGWYYDGLVLNLYAPNTSAEVIMSNIKKALNHIYDKITIQIEHRTGEIESLTNRGESSTVNQHGATHTRWS